MDVKNSILTVVGEKFQLIQKVWLICKKHDGENQFKCCYVFYEMYIYYLFFIG
jgi:hypothetical protein